MADVAILAGRDMPRGQVAGVAVDTGAEYFVVIDGNRRREAGYAMTTVAGVSGAEMIGDLATAVTSLHVTGNTWRGDLVMIDNRAQIECRDRGNMTGRAGLRGRHV